MVSQTMLWIGNVVIGIIQTYSPRRAVNSGTSSHTGFLETTEAGEANTFGYLVYQGLTLSSILVKKIHKISSHIRQSRLTPSFHPPTFREFIIELWQQCSKQLTQCRALCSLTFLTPACDQFLSPSPLSFLRNGRAFHCHCSLYEKKIQFSSNTISAYLMVRIT